MTAQQFDSSAALRHRYWARSYLGWPAFRAARPNDTHEALASLQTRGFVHRLVTQNVDNLHQVAGHQDVLELHGTLHVVDCGACGASAPRDEVQARIAAANVGWSGCEDSGSVDGSSARPDGDAELPSSALLSFVEPACVACGAHRLKPRVVFFGGSIPTAVVEKSYRAVADADAVLLVGSTSSTWSCYRLLERAAGAGKPVGILNRGATRADALASFRIHDDVGALLRSAAETLAAEHRML